MNQFGEEILNFGSKRFKTILFISFWMEEPLINTILTKSELIWSYINTTLKYRHHQSMRLGELMLFLDQTVHKLTNSELHWLLLQLYSKDG